MVFLFIVLCKCIFGQYFPYFCRFISLLKVFIPLFLFRRTLLHFFLYFELLFYLLFFFYLKTGELESGPLLQNGTGSRNGFRCIRGGQSVCQLESDNILFVILHRTYNTKSRQFPKKSENVGGFSHPIQEKQHNFFFFFGQLAYLFMESSQILI